MKLSQSEINNLFEALLDGYRDYDKLRIMVRLKLGEQLERISQDTDTETVVFKLIEWAESNNKVLDLVWGANEKNPENELIRKITYQLYFITQKQWENLWQLLTQIENKALIEVACGQSFKSSQIAEIDPELVNLSSLNTSAKIKQILRDNLIKKRQQSSKNNPSILEFAYYLRKMTENEIDPLRNKLNNWVDEVANQLSIQLNHTEKKKQTLNSLKRKIIQPYLLISLKDLGSQLLLQGELVIEESESETIIEQKTIEIRGNQQGIKCPKKYGAIGHHIKKFISRSPTEIKNCPELKNYCNQNKKINIKPIIVELFLPYQYLLKRMEIIPLPIKSPKIFAEESMKIGCYYQLIFRSLERFETYKENPEYSERLETNWKKINTFFKSQSSLDSQQIKNKFEHLSCFDEEWQILEQRLEDDEKLGINITASLKNNQEILKILKAIIIAGIPLSLWITNKDINPAPDILEKQFIQLLISGENTDLHHLFLKIKQLRRQAYNLKNPKCLGYGLGLLCDNPYRVPFQFQEDDALTA